VVYKEIITSKETLKKYQTFDQPIVIYEEKDGEQIAREYLNNARTFLSKIWIIE
jgi:hypothetical protein